MFASSYVTASSISAAYDLQQRTILNQTRRYDMHICPCCACPKNAAQRAIDELKRLPGVDLMTPHSMRRILHNRAIWFLGDSTMDQFFRALACFVTSDHAYAIKVPDVPFGVVNHLSFVRQDLHLILPRCVRLESTTTHICYVRVPSAHAVLDALTLLTNSGLVKIDNDIFVANFGLHYRWNQPTYSADVQTFATNVTSLKLQHLIWASTDAQHFDTTLGDFHSLSAEQHSNAVCTNRIWQAWKETGTHGPYNDQATPVLRAAGISIFDTWTDTVPLFYAHASVQGDCTHSCSLGSSEMRVVRLHQFLHARLGIK